MPRIHTEIVIAASPDLVWEALIDFERYPEWNPFVQELRGDLIVGQRLAAKLAFGRRGMAIAPVVVEVQPGRCFRWRGAAGPNLFVGVHGFVVEPAGQGTRFVHEEQFSGWLAKPVLALIGGSTRAGFQAMNEALAARCEAPG